jgi:hypothetical protein
MRSTHYPGAWADSCNEDDDTLLKKARDHSAYARECEDRLNRRRSHRVRGHGRDSGCYSSALKDSDDECKRNSGKNEHCNTGRKDKQYRSKHRREDEVSRRGDARSKKLLEHDRKKNKRADCEKDERSKNAHEKKLHKFKDVRERIIQEKCTTYRLDDYEDKEACNRNNRSSHEIAQCKDEGKKNICDKKKKCLREGHEEGGRQDEEDSCRNKTSELDRRDCRRSRKRDRRGRSSGRHAGSDDYCGADDCRWGKRGCRRGQSCDIHEDCSDLSDTCSDPCSSDESASCSTEDSCSTAGGWTHHF